VVALQTVVVAEVGDTEITIDVAPEEEASDGYSEMLTEGFMEDITVVTEAFTILTEDIDMVMVTIQVSKYHRAF